MPGSRDIRAGRAFVSMDLEDSAFIRGLGRAQRRLSDFGRDAARTGAQIASSGAVLGGAVLASVRSFAAAGDALDKASIRTGVSVEALSELGFAAEQSGSSFATLERGIRTMQRSILDFGRGLSTQTEAFETLGLTIGDLAGQTPEEQFLRIAEAISGIADPSTRAALAMQVLGRSGSELVPLFAGGRRAIQELRSEAQGLGLTIDTSDAAEAALVTDELNRLTSVLRRSVFAVGAAVSPTFRGWVEGARDASGATREFVDNNGRLIVGVLKVAGVVTAAGTALFAIGTTAAIASTALGVIAAQAAVVAVAFAGVPVLVAGIVAAFNDGRVAGIDLGGAILTLAEDLRILAAVAPRLAAGRELDRVTKSALAASAASAEARAEVERAPDLRSRLAAQRELVERLQEESEAQAALLVTDRLNNDGQTSPVRQAALDNIGRSAREAEASLEALETQLATTIDQAFGSEARAVVAIEVEGLRQATDAVDAAFGPEVSQRVRLDVESARQAAAAVGADLARLAELDTTDLDVALQVRGRAEELDAIIQRLESLQRGGGLSTEVELLVTAQRDSLQRTVDAIRASVDPELDARLDATVDLSRVSLRGVGRVATRLAEVAEDLAVEVPVEARADLARAGLEVRGLRSEIRGLAADGQVDIEAALAIRGRLDRLRLLADGLDRVAERSDVSAEVRASVALETNTLDAALRTVRAELDTALGLDLSVDVDLAPVRAALAAATAATDALAPTIPVAVRADLGDARTRLAAVIGDVETLAAAERLPIDVAVRLRADLERLGLLSAELRELAAQPGIDAAVRLAVEAEAGAAEQAAAAIRDRASEDLGIDLDAAVNLSDLRVGGLENARRAISRAVAEAGSEVPLRAVADLDQATEDLSALAARLAEVQGEGPLTPRAIVQVSGDRAELADLEATLREIAERGDTPQSVRVAIEAQLAVSTDALATLDAAAGARRTAVVEVEAEASGGGVQSFITAAINLGRERLAAAQDLRTQLAQFGGTAEEAARAQIQAEARRLREAARELGALTPELSDEIDERTRIEISRSLQAEVTARVELTAAGTFDGRLATQALSIDQTRDASLDRAALRSADAAEETARNTRDLAARSAGTLRFD